MTTNAKHLKLIDKIDDCEASQHYQLAASILFLIATGIVVVIWIIKGFDPPYKCGIGFNLILSLFPLLGSIFWFVSSLKAADCYKSVYVYTK